MILAEELRTLSDQGLLLQEEGGRLRVRGPKDVLTPEIQSFLTQYKNQILELLRREPAPRTQRMVPV